MSPQALSALASFAIVLAFLLRVAELRFPLGVTFLLIGFAGLLGILAIVVLRNAPIMAIVRFSPQADIVLFGPLGAALGAVLAGAIVCVGANRAHTNHSIR